MNSKKSIDLGNTVVSLEGMRADIEAATTKALAQVKL